MRQKIILSIVSVIAFFIFIEIIISLLNIKFELYRYMKFEEHFQIDPHLSNGIFLKDRHVFWKNTPNNNELGVNSLGFRDISEISIHKDKNIFRIICIGDSVTYGVPHRINRPQDTFPKVLEGLLNNQVGIKRFEVINAAVPGYSSYQGLQYLKHYLLKFRPDLVIVQFGINDDAGAVYFEDKNQKVQSEWLINLQNILLKSRFYQLFSKVVFYIKNKISNLYCGKYVKALKFYRVSPQDYINNLEKIVQLGKKNNFKVLIIPPAGFINGKVCISENYYNLPQNFMEVDTYQLFRKELDFRNIYADRWHLSPLGHRVLAEGIYKTLLKYNLINK